MRAREMHNKLDRLSGSPDDDEHTCPDISLLSPEDQDWVDEMFEKIRAAKDEVENVIAPAEGRKLLDLLNELPVLGRDDKFAGPDLDIPREIEMHFTLAKWHEEGRHHWPSFDFFHKLKAVQKVRLVELCRQYGWEVEYPRDRSRRYFRLGKWGIPGLLPLSQWDPEDEAELRSLLDVAEV
jgi:hypothetical protein